MQESAGSGCDGGADHRHVAWHAEYALSIPNPAWMQEGAGAGRDSGAHHRDAVRHAARPRRAAADRLPAQRGDRAPAAVRHPCPASDSDPESDSAPRSSGWGKESQASTAVTGVLCWTAIEEACVLAA